jgi:hypothetical protein
MIKYLLLTPIASLIGGYYLLRDMATLLKHGELLRGLIIFILLSIAMMLGCFLVNAVKEINRVRKQVGSDAYEWMVGKS